MAYYMDDFRNGNTDPWVRLSSLLRQYYGNGLTAATHVRSSDRRQLILNIITAPSRDKRSTSSSNSACPEEFKRGYQESCLQAINEDDSLNIQEADCETAAQKFSCDLIGLLLQEMQSECITLIIEKWHLPV